MYKISVQILIDNKIYKTTNWDPSLGILPSAEKYYNYYDMIFW